MRSTIAALPLALGLLGGAITSDAPPDIGMYDLTAEGLLALETLPVAWPELNEDSPHPHTVFGIPKYEGHSDEYNYLREYEGFTVYYDDRVLAPRWTAIKLTRYMADRHSDYGRPGNFRKDPEIEGAGYEVTVHRDYNNPTGVKDWARGHIVQFDDARGWGETSGWESFYTSNIVPQLQDHNGKGWLALEMTCTEFARDYEVVWVYSGPIYDDDPQPFAVGRRVPCPVAFYRIVVSPAETGSVDVLAFRMPHEPIDRDADLTPYLRSVDDIEEETGIDFLAELPDDLENALEKVAWDIWPDLTGEE